MRVYICLYMYACIYARVCIYSRFFHPPTSPTFYFFLICDVDIPHYFILYLLCLQRNLYLSFLYSRDFLYSALEPHVRFSNLSCLLCGGHRSGSGRWHDVSRLLLSFLFFIIVPTMATITSPNSRESRLCLVCNTRVHNSNKMSRCRICLGYVHLKCAIPDPNNFHCNLCLVNILPFLSITEDDDFYDAIGVKNFERKTLISNFGSKNLI